MDGTQHGLVDMNISIFNILVSIIGNLNGKK